MVLGSDSPLTAAGDYLLAQWDVRLVAGLVGPEHPLVQPVALADRILAARVQVTAGPGGRPVVSPVRAPSGEPKKQPGY